MTMKLGRHHPQLNSFHHTDSLLFQFLLSEFLQTFALLTEIDKLVKTRSFSGQDLVDQLHRLVGPTQGFMLLILLDKEGGHLARLKAFTDVLCSKWGNELRQNALIKLQTSIHKSRLDAIESLDALDIPNEEELYACLEKLQTNSQLIKKNLENVIFYFKEDENVIFFLIRHQPQLAAIYGSEFLPKLFEKMYPNGLKEAEVFVTTAYTRRHFDRLIPIIKSYFSHMEKAS